MSELIKIRTKDGKLMLPVTKGHFATSHSHINYYIDVTKLKSCLDDARTVAELLRVHYNSKTIVDTILCLDGMEVIGTCLAEALTRAEYTNINAKRAISILTPEHTMGSQIIFRDNISPMIKGKHVLILATSVASGYTAQGAITAVRYYGGKTIGISAIFATAKDCIGIPVHSILDPTDLTGYGSFPVYDCPMCNDKQKIDAVINNFGCSNLE